MKVSRRPGQWIVYMDIYVPFTRRVIVCDFGYVDGRLYHEFGWRFA